MESQNFENELTNCTMIGEENKNIIIRTTEMKLWLKISALWIFYLSKTLPLPTPLTASFSPSKTCIKFFGVTLYKHTNLSHNQIYSSYQTGIIMRYTLINIISIRMIDNNTFRWISSIIEIRIFLISISLTQHY
jgi:hypothetical protein